MEDYTSNSHKSKAEPQNIPSTRKTVAKSSGVKKKNEFQRFVELFITEDIKNIKSYVLKEWLVPSVIDGIKSTIDFIFDSSDARYSRSEPSKSRYRDYNKMGGRRINEPYRARNVYDYDIPTFTRKEEAERVLEYLDEMIDTNQVVSVMDLFSAAGRSCDYTYDDYGWSDIRSAEVAHCREGWYIRLPRPMPLTRR